MKNHILELWNKDRSTQKLIALCRQLKAVAKIKPEKFKEGDANKFIFVTSFFHFFSCLIGAI